MLESSALLDSATGLEQFTWKPKEIACSDLSEASALSIFVVRSAEKGRECVCVQWGKNGFVCILELMRFFFFLEGWWGGYFDVCPKELRVSTHIVLGKQGVFVCLALCALKDRDADRHYRQSCRTNELTLPDPPQSRYNSAYEEINKKKMYWYRICPILFDCILEQCNTCSVMYQQYYTHICTHFITQDNSVKYS